MTFSSESDEPDPSKIIWPHDLKRNEHKSVSSTDKQMLPELPETGKKVERPVKNHVCEYVNCLAKFSRPWRLSAHVAAKHSGQKPFPCDYSGCDKKYTSSSHLRRHKSSAHPSENKESRRFKCSYPGCRVVLKSKLNERKHYRRTHEPREFRCPDCPASFTKRSRLKTHFFIHSGIPPFQCKKCGNGFTKAGDLERHMRGHVIHICPETGCSLALDSWSAMRKHLGVSHKKRSSSFFKCHDCGKMYTVKIYLQRHIEARHLNENSRRKMENSEDSVQCYHCENYYTTKGSLKRHVEVVHLKMGKKKKEKAVGRARRKDAGIPRRSLASVLSMLELPPNIEKELKESTTIPPVPFEEVVLNHLLQETSPDIEENTKCIFEDNSGEASEGNDSKKFDEAPANSFFT